MHCVDCFWGLIVFDVCSVVESVVVLCSRSSECGVLRSLVIFRNWMEVKVEEWEKGFEAGRTAFAHGAAISGCM